MLENTEGAIKKGKSRESGNRVHKTMEKKTKTQHNIKISYLKHCITMLFIQSAVKFTEKVPCVVSPWGPWSHPNNYGLSKRVRSVIQEPLHGGKDCPPLEQTRNGMYLSCYKLYVLSTTI
jgi:hypothetical protein